MSKIDFFEECDIWWWGGYYVPVRDSFNYHLKKEHLSEKEKEIYETEFGETILLDYEFEDWYDRIKKELSE